MINIDSYYKKDLKLTTRLQKLKMPLLKADEKKLIDKANEYYKTYSKRSTIYFSFINLFDKKILLRIFAVRLKSGILQYQEVQRRLEGLYYFPVRNLYLNSCSGYTTVWQKKGNYYFNENEYNVWEFSYEPKYFNIFANPLWNTEELFKLDPSLKYCNVTNITYPFNFITWITVYRNHPCIEMLSKFNLNSLFSDNVIKRIEKKDKTFISYIIKNREIIREYRINYNTIIYAMKYNFHLYDAFILMNLSKDRKILAEELYSPALIKYLFKVRKEIDFYLDYYTLVREFHLDETKNKVIYPHDLKEAHDDLMELKSKKMAKEKKTTNIEINKKLELVKTKYLFLCLQNDKYLIKIPSKIDEFISEGIEQKNCVARLDYYKKMADGKNLILFMRKIENPNKSFVTIEFNQKESNIVQARFYNNEAVKGEVKDYLYEEWLPKVKNLLEVNY